MIEKLYTVEEVAEMASVTGRTIRNYLKSGKLVGRKIGGQWRFPESEVQRLLTGESPEEYYAQEAPENPIPQPTPQNFDAGNFSQDQQSYAPVNLAPTQPVSTQATSFGGVPSYVAPVEENFSASVPNSSTNFQTTQPVQQNNQYVQPVNTVSNSPNLEQQPINQPAPQNMRSTAQEQNSFAQPVNSNNTQNHYTNRINSENSPQRMQPAQENFANANAPLYQQQQNVQNPSQRETLPQQNSYTQQQINENQQYQNYQANSNPQITYAQQTQQPFASQNPFMGQTPYQNEPVQVAENPTVQQFQQPAAQNNTYQPPVQTRTEPRYNYAAQETYSSPKATDYNTPIANTEPANPQKSSALTELLNAYAAQVSNSTSSQNPKAPAEAMNQPTAAAKENITENKDKIEENSKTQAPTSDLSDVGKQVTKFLGEVHDCSNGPQVCAVVDLYQPLEAAKITSQRLTEMAEIESENGIPCNCYVEFDSRYYVARYTLFGSSFYLAQCLELIG